MQVPDYLGADDLGDSIYARELRANSARFRFSPDLEGQYSADHLRRARLRVRIWFSLNLVVAIGAMTAQLLRHRAADTTFWILLLGFAFCAAAPMWLACSKLYERHYAAAAAVLVPLLGAFNAMFVAEALSRGSEGAIAALTVNVIAAFFFAGLLFRTALVAALVVPLALGIGAIFFGVPPVVALRSIVVLVLTGALAAIIYRDTELAYRRSFLEAGLIRELAARDGLTGLMNRRAFDKHLLRVWQQAQRDRRTLTILLIDIDHFKTYNDSYGHQAGDEALRSVAQILKEFARRPLDLAARYGGEEFSIILYDLALPHVQDIAERIRLAVQSAPVPNPRASAVTVSIGIGTVTPTMGRTPAGAVQLADGALYEAKRHGRNVVVVAGIAEYETLETGTFKTSR
jgi:diguanylate cyclase (GGDEF)-like protein